MIGISINAPKTISEFMRNYDIPEEYTSAINGLRGRNIVVIADNSGSMKHSLFNNRSSQTRWVKLFSIIYMIFAIAPLLGRAFDICFLNPLDYGKYAGNYYIEGINKQEDVQECFSGEPRGPTPLIDRINEVIKKYRPTLAEKGLTLYISIDGINTNAQVQEKPGAMKDWVQHTFAQDPLLREHVHINFYLLSDEKKVRAEYEGIDKLKGPKGEHLCIDVVNLPHIEKEQFEKAHNGKAYTEGVEAAKILTGASNIHMDAADEKQVELTEAGNVNIAPSPAGCCIIS